MLQITKVLNQQDKTIVYVDLENLPPCSFSVGSSFYQGNSVWRAIGLVTSSHAKIDHSICILIEKLTGDDSIKPGEAYLT